MSAKTSQTDWRKVLGKTLPAMVDRLTPSRLKLLAGREQSDNPLNSHDHPELCVVMEGRLCILNDGDPISLRQGDVLMVSPWMYHVSKAQASPAETLWLGASPRHLGGAISTIDADGQREMHAGLDFLDFEPANPLMRQLIDEMKNHRSGWVMMCRSLLLELLVEALRRLKEYGRPLPPPEDFSTAEVLTYNARHYIQRNFRHQLTLAQVAHHVALSPNYLATLFKRQFSMTIIDFLTQVRLEEAKRLLVETDRKVADVAYEVGYHSPYYFSRAFKKSVGVPPKAFRQQAASRKSGN